MSSILLATTHRFATGIPRNGLQLHLDANNSNSYSGSNNTWRDISGNNRNFSLQNKDFRNSGGIKYFDTWGMKITGPASNSFGINNNSGFTIIVVCRPADTSATGGRHLSSSFCWLGATGNRRGISTHIPWDENVWLDLGNGGGGSPSQHRLNGDMSGFLNSWSMFTFRSNASNSSATAFRSIYGNLSPIASTTIPDADLNLSRTGARIAYGDGGGNSTWNARLGSFIVYNRSLSGAELAGIYHELKPLYGLP